MIPVHLTVTQGRIIALQSAISSCALMKLRPQNMKGLGPRSPPTTGTILIALPIPLHLHRALGDDNVRNGGDNGAGSSYARLVRESPCLLSPAQWSHY